MLQVDSFKVLKLGECVHVLPVGDVVAVALLWNKVTCTNIKISAFAGVVLDSADRF